VAELKRRCNRFGGWLVVVIHGINAVAELKRDRARGKL
jgi:hypothetical protein